ncbi:hypothetical protein OROMI_020615 [Orobanche minor]
MLFCFSKQLGNPYNKPPSGAELFLVTRKRDEKRTYRASKEKSSTSITNVSDLYLEELTTKIRDELADKMEEKLNQKVRKMMNRLAERNPDLQVNMDEQSADFSSVDSDANPTP